MDAENQKKEKLKWKQILFLASLVLGIFFLLLKLFPDYYELIVFGLYSIPSHMLISPFPHEPALLYTAKYYSPTAISIAGTIGCCLAGIFDYWLLIPLLNHDVVRPKFEDKPLFRKSLAFFKKSPFWLLVIAAYTPIPFYPFKFLSIAGKYPIWKYEAALIVGRTPRYFTLALLGYALQPPTWTLIALFMVLILLPVANRLYARWKKKSAVLPKHSERTLTEDSELLLANYDNLTTVPDSSGEFPAK